MSHKICQKFKNFVTYVVIFALAVASLPVSPVLATAKCAIEKDDLEFYAKNNILYFCPKLVTEGGIVCTSIPAGGSGDNASIIMGALMGGGYDQNAAAGIIGNLMQESGGNLDTYVIEGGRRVDDSFRAWPKTFSGGFGLAQWTSEDRVQGLQAYADSKGLPVTSVQVQVEYLMIEAPQNNSSPAQMNGMSVEAATEWFMRKFERPGVEALSSRISYAQSVLGITPSDPGFETICDSIGTGGGGIGESVNIDGFMVYNQCDGAWGGMAFGTSSFCAAGCGPTSFAMIATALLGRTVTPGDIAAIPGLAGQYVTGAGSAWTVTSFLAGKLGLNSRTAGAGSASDAVSVISSALASGAMIHTSGQGPEPFTSSGHYIAIVGEKDGKWLVADSYRSTLKAWDPYQIASYMALGNINIVSK